MPDYSYVKKIAGRYSALLAELSVVYQRDRETVAATIDEINRRTDSFRDIFFPSRAGDDCLLEPAKNFDEDSISKSPLGAKLPPADKRRKSRWKDFIILSILNSKIKRAIGVADLLVGFSQEDIKTTRSSLVTKLNRMKKDYQFIEWSDKSGASDIKITDAGRVYLIQLKSQWLGEQELNVLGEIVANAVSKVK